MKKIVCILLALVAVLSLASCDGALYLGETTPTDEDSTPVKNDPALGIDSNGNEVAITKIDSLNENETVPLSSPELLSELSCSDNRYNYFFLKLGEIKNVPVLSEVPQHHSGLNTTYQWSTTTLSEEIYENSIQNSITSSTTAKAELTLKTSTSASLKAKYKGIESGIDSTASQTLTEALSKTDSSTYTQKFTSSVSNVVSEMKSVVITLGNNDANGFYRYTVYADYEIYAVLMCDFTTCETVFTYFSLPKDNSFRKMFRYSADGEFDSIKNDAKLELTEDMLNSLDVDLFTELETKASGTVLATAYYKAENKRHIDDAGYYGLGQKARENMSFPELSEYAGKNGYEIIFEIKINSDVYKNVLGNVVQGYREVHLYNKENPSTFDKNISEEIAYEDYGWLCEYIFNDKDSTIQKFTFAIDSEEFRENMYIRYDAHGESEDDWYIVSIEINVTVVTK